MLAKLKIAGPGSRTVLPPWRPPFSPGKLRAFGRKKAEAHGGASRPFCGRAARWAGLMVGSGGCGAAALTDRLHRAKRVSARHQPEAVQEFDQALVLVAAEQHAAALPLPLFAATAIDVCRHFLGQHDCLTSCCWVRRTASAAPSEMLRLWKCAWDNSKTVAPGSCLLNLPFRV
jgi:hypothetical protein